MDASGRCAICLEAIANEAFPDVCFHRFCFDCILYWSDIVFSKKRITECPLCKTTFSSIIHGFNGTAFQRHTVTSSAAPTSRVFTSPAHAQRLAAYGKNSDTKHVATVGNGDNGRWLRYWVQRELQALMQDEDVDVVVHHVIGTLESLRKRSVGSASRRLPSFSQLARAKQLDLDSLAAAVRPFVFDHADKFGDELSRFLASGLTIAAYDTALDKASEEVVTDLEGRVKEALFDEEDDSELLTYMDHAVTSCPQECLDDDRRKRRREDEDRDIEAKLVEGEAARKKSLEVQLRQAALANFRKHLKEVGASSTHVSAGGIQGTDPHQSEAASAASHRPSVDTDDTAAQREGSQEETRHQEAGGTAGAAARRGEIAASPEEAAEARAEDVFKHRTMSVVRGGEQIHVPQRRSSTSERSA